jgi:hypothetical protein
MRTCDALTRAFTHSLRTLPPVYMLLGRGPLAGPVVAAACVIGKDVDETLLQDVNDSKQLDETKVFVAFLS